MMRTETARSRFDWSDFVETLDKIGDHHERVLLSQSTLAADDLHANALNVKLIDGKYAYILQENRGLPSQGQFKAPT